MYHLCYCSTEANPLVEKELIDLLHASRARNQKRGITGVLLYLEPDFKTNFFVQFIEGPQSEVEALYRKIKVDERHRNVKLLSEGPVHQRLFPDWKMAFDRCSEIELGGFFDLGNPPTSFTDYLLLGRTPHLSLELMANFYRNRDLSYSHFW